MVDIYMIYMSYGSPKGKNGGNDFGFVPSHFITANSFQSIDQLNPVMLSS